MELYQLNTVGRLVLFFLESQAMLGDIREPPTEYCIRVPREKDANACAKARKALIWSLWKSPTATAAKGLQF